MNSLRAYKEFIATKRFEDPPTGLDLTGLDLNPMLYDFQRDIVRWALRRGRASIFADCGLGKTPMQLEWARHVQGRKLIIAPLAVASQTCREAEKFGIDGVAYLRADDGKTPIAITNYEMVDRFNPRDFNGVVLDESSILKSYTGKFRTKVIKDWGVVPFRLAATATPAPNDYMELGNHAEFMGVMTRSEMLSMFFIHDGSETQQWRLKGHGQDKFWRWLCSWAVMLRNPTDLGYKQNGFNLPPLKVVNHAVEPTHGHELFLFPMPASSLQERITARKLSVEDRAACAAEIIKSDGCESWLIWCNLNRESEIISKLVEAVEVRGSDSVDLKEDRMLGFSSGKYKRLVTKPSIAGFGMNWQHCARMAFVGLSDSYEQFYQAVRRCWRFGQTRPVESHIVIATTEGAVLENIKAKERASEEMNANMVEHMRSINSDELRGIKKVDRSYVAAKAFKKPSL